MSLNQVSQDLGSMIGTGVGGALLLLFEYRALSLLSFATLIASGIFYLFTIDPTCSDKAKHIPIVESHIVHHKCMGGEK
jgi:hypothetical protein